jgi:hypothetical protein
MFVPDFMHEFELGVWKAVFTHLMRILHTYGNDTISILNSRVVGVSYIFRSHTLVTDTVMFLHLVVLPFENFITMPPQ